MTLIEKRPIFSMLSNIIIYFFYFKYALALYGSDSMPSDPLQYWAMVFVLLVPIMIVAKIILYILFSILNTIITREMEEDHPRDEFGKKIERLATRNFYHLFMVGLMASFSLAALGWGVEWMFKGLFATIVVSGFAHDISELYYQHKGV